MIDINEKPGIVKCIKTFSIDCSDLVYKKDKYYFIKSVNEQYTNYTYILNNDGTFEDDGLCLDDATSFELACFIRCKINKIL